MPPGVSPARAPVAARMTEAGAGIVAGSPVEIEAFSRNESNKWNEAFRAHNIRAESRSGLPSHEALRNVLGDHS